MVDRDVLLRKAIDKLCDFTLSLKVEQRDAVDSLLDGHDVLAVLPTGFGKSLIFQVFVIAAEMERERLQTALVLCPCRASSMTRFPRPEIWVFQLRQLPIYPWRS